MIYLKLVGILGPKNCKEEELTVRVANLCNSELLTVDQKSVCYSGHVN